MSEARVMFDTKSTPRPLLIRFARRYTQGFDRDQEIPWALTVTILPYDLTAMTFMRPFGPVPLDSYGNLDADDCWDAIKPSPSRTSGNDSMGLPPVWLLFGFTTSERKCPNTEHGLRCSWWETARQH